jgi:vacuolar-type H+-ATPase subunit C/Vma6
MALGAEAISYAAANARVAGLKAQLLRSEDWAALLAADSLPHTLEALRGTPHGRSLSAAEGQRPGLESLERRLLGGVAANVLKAAALIRGASRALLHVWWAHFELENVKSIFRGVEQGIGPAQMRDYLIPLGEHSRIDWEALLHERSVAALVERMADTHYINPLRNALHLYARFGTLFPLEVAMDVRYYRDIPAAIKQLGAGESLVAKRLLGTHLDILNILWAFRYRVYYRLSAEEIINFTIWHTVHTDVALIQAIATGAPPAEIVERIWGPESVDLSPLDQVKTEAEQLPLLELALQRYWRGLAASAMTGYPFGLGPILGYVILQEIEVLDLVTILEAKALGWGQDRIQGRLLRVDSATGRRGE